MRPTVKQITARSTMAIGGLLILRVGYPRSGRARLSASLPRLRHGQLCRHHQDQLCRHCRWVDSDYWDNQADGPAGGLEPNYLSDRRVTFKHCQDADSDVHVEDSCREDWRDDTTGRAWTVRSVVYGLGS